LLLFQAVSPEKDTYLTVLWFKTGWFVSDKVYRKAGRGANGAAMTMFMRDKDLVRALGYCLLALGLRVLRSSPKYMPDQNVIVQAVTRGYPVFFLCVLRVLCGE
jgi:hypothetical protein